MTNILKGLLNQVALYWTPGVLTESGMLDYSSITPIEIACHWSFENLRVISLDGDSLRSTSRVITSYQVQEGGVLWLSTAKISDPAGTALGQVPASVPTQQTIEYVEHHHSISADETMYKAFL